MTATLDRDNSPTEARRQAIQAKIDAAKTDAERNRLGQFATPHALAVDIARFVAPLTAQGIRFADPSVGTGSFYSAALAVFGTKRLAAATGVELDPIFADAARSLWSESGLEVLRGDFTRVVANGTRPACPNLILANPPYVRHHHIDRADKERLQQLAYALTGVEVSGLAGLYVYFLLLATAWMEEDGIAAWLIPSEFMDVNYGTSLKRFLAERVTLIRVHRFDPEDVQFGDALVSSAVLVFRKTRPRSGHQVEFTYGGSLEAPKACDLIPAGQLGETRKWTAYPADPRNDRHTTRSEHGPALGDFFRVQRGIATGCNKFFVMDRAEAARRSLPEKYLRPILPSPRNLKLTTILAADDGYPLMDRQLCLLDCDLPLPAVKAGYPALAEYLDEAGSLGILDGYLLRKRSPWYRQEQREAAPFLCTYMGRGTNHKQPFRFVLNRSRAIATNLYLMLYPQNALAKMLDLFPDRDTVVHELLSQVTGHEMRGKGRVYGGGLNKIEPSELARISAASFVERWPELLVPQDGKQRLLAL